MHGNEEQKILQCDEHNNILQEKIKVALDHYNTQSQFVCMDLQKNDEKNQNRSYFPTKNESSFMKIHELDTRNINNMNHIDTKKIHNLTNSKMQINHKLQSQKEEVSKAKPIIIIDKNKKIIRRRRALPKSVKKTIIIWLKAHSLHPYPSIEEKRKFANVYGLEERDIIMLFTYERNRLFSGKNICHKNMSNILEKGKS